MTRSPEILARFHDKVDVRGPEDCWPWTAARMPRGYGRFKDANGRIEYAHRVAFSIANGVDLPPEVKVRHTCDNPPCCNPAHLLEGTQAQNIEDARKRRRHTFHEGHPNARLSAVDVQIIRRSEETSAALALRFGVSRPTVSKIRNGKLWATVSMEQRA